MSKKDNVYSEADDYILRIAKENLKVKCFL